MSIIPFTYGEKQIRVLTDENGEALFVAKDVAEMLGYKDINSAVRQHCKGAAKYHPLLTTGGMQDVRVIYEPDVWRLIIGSNLPHAEKIEAWVFEEVLPSIRKTGRYDAGEKQYEAEQELFSSEEVAQALGRAASTIRVLKNYHKDKLQYGTHFIAKESGTMWTLEGVRFLTRKRPDIFEALIGIERKDPRDEYIKALEGERDALRLCVNLLQEKLGA